MSKKILKAGDEVEVRYNGRWVDGVYTVSHTWYTTEGGRQYSLRENGDTFKEDDIRPVTSSPK